MAKAKTPARNAIATTEIEHKANAERSEKATSVTGHRMEPHRGAAQMLIGSLDSTGSKRRAIEIDRHVPHNDGGSGEHCRDASGPARAKRQDGCRCYSPQHNTVAPKTLCCLVSGDRDGHAREAGAREDHRRLWHPICYTEPAEGRGEKGHRPSPQGCKLPSMHGVTNDPRHSPAVPQHRPEVEQRASG